MVVLLVCKASKRAVDPAFKGIDGLGPCVKVPCLDLLLADFLFLFLILCLDLGKVAKVQQVLRRQRPKMVFRAKLGLKGGVFFVNVTEGLFDQREYFVQQAA